MSMPLRVQRFRDEYRRENIGPRYSGWGHVAFISAVCVAVVVAAAWRVERVAVLEWLAVPVSFVFANLVEYLMHRGPMHRRRRGLGLLYRRHAAQHHRFYTREAMSCDSPRDFHIILFPPHLVIVFIAAVTAPLALLCWWLFTANVAWLFVATAVGYYAVFEWLHFSYHLPPASMIGSLPFMASLRRMHTLHHDPALMRKHNFNITFPICDWLFGTYLSARER